MSGQSRQALVALRCPAVLWARVTGRTGRTALVRAGGLGGRESVLAKGLVEATARLGSPCAIVSLLCRKVQTIFEINSIYCSYLRNLKITNVHMFSKESLKFACCQCICLGSCCAKSSWNHLSTILTIKDWSKEGSSLFVLIRSPRLKQKIASHIKLNYMALYFHYSSIPLYYCSWITLFSMGSGLWLLNLTHFTQELPLIRLELRAELLWLALQTSTVAECHRLFSYYKEDIVCLNSQNWADDSRNRPHWAP